MRALTGRKFCDCEIVSRPQPLDGSPDEIIIKKTSQKNPN